MKILRIKEETVIINSRVCYRKVIYLEIEQGATTIMIKRVLNNNDTFSYKGKKYKVKLEVLGE